MKKKIINGGSLDTEVSFDKRMGSVLICIEKDSERSLRVLYARLDNKIL